MMKWLASLIALIYLAAFGCWLADYLDTGQSVDLADTILFGVLFVFWFTVALVRWSA